MDMEHALQAVEAKMIASVGSDVPVLQDASRHILQAGGKRMRPRLAMLAYESVGGRERMEVVPIAAAVELVHTATLVHDDINDHGVTRRGRPTINSIWGRTFALLTGDFLFTKVYELMAPYGDLNITFARMTSDLVEGETLQAHAAKTGTLDRETYARIIAKKTASLFAGAAKMGAILGGGTPAQVDLLEQYGFNVGLAFQITDDILDLIADSETLGKTAGIDLAQGRGFAMASLNGTSGTGVAVAEAVQDDAVTAFKRKLLTGNYIQEGQENARQLALIAEMSLSGLPETPARDLLCDLARQAVDRTY
ncbi:MAG TPA: polyprenyl synthetase family protein [Aggregatilineales bacterium]|nr:polyprenyl synthetase family protein [Anaerolineales bacterium]HRE47990.1 polyprenyl synthetase family protein [Aggregatilineales bacterium]